MRTSTATVLIILSAVCFAACWAEDPSDAKVESITNENAKEALIELQEVAEEVPADLPPEMVEEKKAMDKERFQENVEQMSASPFADKTDAELTALLKARVEEYGRTCDTLKLGQFLDDMGNDPVLIKWGGKNLQVTKQLKQDLDRMERTCKGEKGDAEVRE